MLSTRTIVLSLAFLLVVVPWLLWRVPVVRRVAPLAVIQIGSGVLLGPTCLGRLAPEAYAALFPAPVLAAVNGLGTVGVLLFVFVSGLHLDVARLGPEARRLWAPAVGSMGVPLLLGFGAGLWIVWSVPGVAGPQGGVLATAVSVAICTAVTALPVLAAILREMGLVGTRLGQTALALAAINDAALWLLIAVLLALSHGSTGGTGGSTGGGTGEVLLVLGLSTAWLGVLLLLVRPALDAVVERGGGDTVLVAVLGVAFASGAATELFGLGYLTGGFVAGAVVPVRARAVLLERLEPLTTVALLPFFFVSTGLRALIEPDSPVFMGTFALLSLVAVAGKVLGTALPARRNGEDLPFALALGALMQSKGLMEVVVLTVLLDAGLIGRELFSALVAMAMLCTVLTAPATRLALGRRTAAIAGAAH